MNDHTCSVDGCGKPVKSRGWCQAHYFRWRRNGDVGGPELQTKDGSHRCHIEGCDRKHSGLGLCDVHFQRYRKWGDPYYVEEKPRRGQFNGSWGGDNCGYAAAHDRVRAIKGRVHDYSCADCGDQAKHWSYNHQDPDEKSEVQRGQLLPYSLDPDYYEPRCVPCHKRFDLDRLARETA